MSHSRQERMLKNTQGIKSSLPRSISIGIGEMSCFSLALYLRIIQSSFNPITSGIKMKLSHFINYCVVAQLCPALCNLTDCSPPGSSFHGNLQARILDWVAIPFSRVSSQLRDWTHVSCPKGRFFTFWATREAQWNINVPHSHSKHNLINCT